MAWVRLQRSDDVWMSFETNEISCVHHSMTEEEDWEIQGFLVDLSNGTSFWLNRDEWGVVQKAIYEENVRMGRI